jgi:hypothetical protein
VEIVTLEEVLTQVRQLSVMDRVRLIGQVMPEIEQDLIASKHEQALQDEAHQSKSEGATDLSVLDRRKGIKQQIRNRFAHVPKDRHLADELIAERREEARKESSR